MAKKQSEKVAPKKVGCPSIYTPELAERICDLISTHPWSLQQIRETYPEFPVASAIRKWRHKYPEFEAMYARAKIKQADILAEEILEIARTCTNKNWQQSRMMIEAHKWLASKLIPKQYGDKQIIEHKAEVTPEEEEKLYKVVEGYKIKHDKEY